MGTQKRIKKVKYSLKAPESLATRLSGNSQGQRIRSKFMRDRDRVLYSKAFRRLAGKTQVFLSGLDDHQRTRLTHTLEVSQISRTISRQLELDLDLTEAIALGHDIGHTPYGHAGERTLHEIMTCYEKHIIPSCPFDKDNINIDDIDSDTRKCLGFKHNFQSLKVLMCNEKNYGEYGLDLTNFTLFGIQFHSGNYYSPAQGKCHDHLEYYNQFIDKCCFNGEKEKTAWSFEAFVVRESDEIAQRHHDLEDALRGKLISETEVYDLIRDSFFEFFDTTSNKILRGMRLKTEDAFIADMSKLMVNLFVQRLINSSSQNINKLILDEKLNSKNFKNYVINNSPNDEKIQSIISYSTHENMEDGFMESYENFKKDISKRVISSHEIQKADAQGKRIIKKIFTTLYENPDLLPNHSVYDFLVLSKKYNSISELNKKVKESGSGFVRSQFSDLYRNSKTRNRESEIILMRIICDYIAGMTDSYAHNLYNELS